MTTFLQGRHSQGSATKRPKYARWRTEARAVWLESRPGVQLVFLLRLLAGSGVIRKPSIECIPVIAGWLLVTIAIYVYNGVSDVVADMGNGSTRPIAAGKLSIPTAVSWSVALSICGLLLCSLDGAHTTALAALMLALGWAYSSGPALKDSPAGFAVVIGLGAGLTYIAGWLSRGAPSADAAIVLGVATWVGLACVAKDFSDVDGDRFAGRRTWPVVLGARRAAWLAASLATATAGGVLAYAALTGTDVVAASVLSAGSIALAVALVRSATLPERHRRRRPYRVFMLTQYATNLVLIAAIG